MHSKRIVLVASRKKTWGVRMNITSGQMRIESDNPDLGQGRESWMSATRASTATSALTPST